MKIWSALAVSLLQHSYAQFQSRDNRKNADNESQNAKH
jgi:hypothetical protein